MGRVAEVNRELKRRGIAERLRRGRGYHYFYNGDAMAWPTSSVFTNRADIMTVDQWIAEHARLKAEGSR
jgi:hypothetical protein